MEFPLSRDEYPVLEQMTYLDTPFEGLVARSIWERIEGEVRVLQNDFRQHDANWRYAVRDEVREITADMIGVEPDQLALIPGFSFGLRALLPWLTPFRKVLMIENDYPTMIDAFASGSFELTFVERNQDGSCSYDDLAFAMEQNAGGIFAFSHVFNEVGFRFNPERIAALANAHGVLTVMDVTQSFGSMPLDLSTTGIDVALCSTYKWTGSGFGNGFLTVRPECEKLQGVIGQFNTGHLDPFAMLRLKYGLERLQVLQLPDIWIHIEELNQVLCDGLNANGIAVYSCRIAENRSAIIQFEGTEETQQRLERTEIRTSFRGRGIRMGVHWYNTHSDIERLLNAL
jgi:selenocysteine lyase/cysteine desulfurase